MEDPEFAIYGGGGTTSTPVRVRNGGTKSGTLGTQNPGNNFRETGGSAKQLIPNHLSNNMTFPRRGATTVTSASSTPTPLPPSDSLFVNTSLMFQVRLESVSRLTVSLEYIGFEFLFQMFCWQVA